VLDVQYFFYLSGSGSKMTSWIFSHIDIFISSLITGIISFVAGIIYKNEPLTDPFILEVFISNLQHSDAPVGFKVKNTTKIRLKTDITISPIVHNVRYSPSKYEKVLNPGEEYIVSRIEGDYKYIRFINEKHHMNTGSYQNNQQPLKFELRAHFRNNRFQVMKIHNSTTILSAYEPKTKEFLQIE
jgi:hypothetical protein